jgi:hypothetical protein
VAMDVAMDPVSSAVGFLADSPGTLLNLAKRHGDVTRGIP